MDKSTKFSEQLTNGYFDKRNCYGFYDWFCENYSLEDKSRVLLAKAKKIFELNRKSGNVFFNPETSYVWFKNNCPGDGTLYDDLRIADVETNEVLYCVVPHSGHRSVRGQSELSGRPGGNPITEFVMDLAEGTWQNVLNYFVAPVVPVYENDHEGGLHDDHFEIECPLCRHRMYVLQEGGGSAPVDVSVKNVDKRRKLAVVELLSPSPDRQEIDSLCICDVKDLHPLLIPTEAEEKAETENKLSAKAQD